MKTYIEESWYVTYKPETARRIMKQFGIELKEDAAGHWMFVGTGDDYMALMDLIEGK